MDMIPILSSDNNYRERVILDGIAYWFMVRWNSRDAAWYLDIFEGDLTPIVTSLKVVLGATLGSQQSYVPFFQEHVLRIFDSTNSGRDAAYDDLGTRIQILHMTMDEFRGGSSA